MLSTSEHFYHIQTLIDSLVCSHRNRLCNFTFCFPLHRISVVFSNCRLLQNKQSSCETVWNQKKATSELICLRWAHATNLHPHPYRFDFV